MKRHRDDNGLPVSFLVASSADDLAEAVRELRLDESPFLGIDTETTGLDPIRCRVRLVQIAAPERSVLLADLFRIRTAEAREPLRRLLTGKAVKIFQNAAFDLAFLAGEELPVAPPLFDTMLAAQLAACGEDDGSHGLGALAARHLGVDLPKELGRSDWRTASLSSEQLCYAARDAAILLPLREALVALLRSKGLVGTAKLEFDCVFAIAEMHATGMPLSRERFDALRTTLEEEKAAALKVLRAALGALPRQGQLSLFDDGALVNPDSTKQLLEALRLRGGLPLTGTSRSDLEPFADHPAVKALLEYRKIAKAASAFGDAIAAHIHPVTGRLHSHYAQVRTPTGRLACAAPNIQQIPREARFRRCFAAPPGKRLVLADYSQIELRVAAEISGDARMREAYRSGEDLHRVTASLVTGKAPEDVTKGERQLAKAINFGLIYAMGARGLQRYAQSTFGAAMTGGEAEHFRSRFFDAYSGIAAWHRKEAENPSAEVRTLSGRLRRIPPGEGLPGRLNTPVQGTAADILKEALGRLPAALSGTEARIVASVHDEILLEVPEEHATAAAEILSRTMEDAGARFLASVPVMAEAVVAESWAEK